MANLPPPNDLYYPDGNLDVDIARDTQLMQASNAPAISSLRTEWLYAPIVEAGIVNVTSTSRDTFVPLSKEKFPVGLTQFFVQVVSSSIVNAQAYTNNLSSLSENGFEVSIRNNLGQRITGTVAWMAVNLLQQ